MKSLVRSVLSSSTLKLAGSKDSACQPVLQSVHGNEGSVDVKLVEGVRVDPVIAFNELVLGLFMGSPPWCMEHLEEAEEVSMKYQEIANMLRSTADIDGYFRFAQAAAFLKKYEAMPKANERRAEEATLRRWHDNERINRDKNSEFWDILQRPLTTAFVDLQEVTEKVRQEILSLVGEFPPDFKDVASFGKFGPGASLSHRAGELDPILKCINPTALESQRSEVLWLLNMTHMGEAIFASRTGCVRSDLFSNSEKVAIAVDGIEWVDHERYATVPKNVSIMRSIGVGASLGTFIQQAYDGWLRSALKSQWSLDLSNQEPNRFLAFRGSLQKTLDRPCTIDLTDASSRICCGLVGSVFSKPWARVLFRQRAKYCLLPGGSKHRLEMFSAMGNALTFSLQTLIFASVVRSVLRDQGASNAVWRVYGDDIIVPHSCFDEVCRRLILLGFAPNMSKSFKDGFFRESCGCDYLHGTNVRPLYFKKPVKDVCDAYKMINLVQLFAAESPIPVWSYRRLYKYLLTTVPKELRLFGEPSEVLDGYIWAPITGLPRKILGCSAVTLDMPDYWAYQRELLVGECGESHIRKGNSRRQATLGGDLELYPSVKTSHSRPGIGLPGRQWRWFRVIAVNRKRLQGLSSKIISLFI